MTAMRIAFAVVAAAGMFAGLERPAALQAPTSPPGITRAVLADNPTVLVARLTLAPNAREESHTHPFSAVVVQMTPGQVEVEVDGSKATERRDTGHVQFIRRQAPHAAANVGTASFDIVAIAIKPDRAPAGSAPTTEPPRGITRRAILDNDEARVTLVRFEPAAREPVHAHPFDLVLVQLTPARMEVQIGEEKTVKDYDAGAVIFLSRNVPHAVSSAGASPFEILSVTVK